MTHDVKVTSRKFKSKYNTKASWSGVWVNKGDPVRRWEIDGEESYEPIGMNDVLNRLEEGCAEKIEDADEALALLKEYGTEVIFVTKVRRKSMKKVRAGIKENGKIKKKGNAREWSEGEFKTYVGQHADFYILRDTIDPRSDHEIVNEKIEELKRDRCDNEFIRKHIKRLVTRKDLDVKDSYIHNKV